jgi:hypothetical protein
MPGTDLLMFDYQRVAICADDMSGPTQKIPLFTEHSPGLVILLTTTGEGVNCIINAELN